MNRQIYRRIILFVMLLCLVGFKVRAQYDDILHPQTKEEVALMKQLHVMGETDFILEKGGRKPAIGRAFNKDGQIVAWIEFARHRYYKYDEQGRVVGHLDSIFNEDHTLSSAAEYRFTYGSDGYLATAKLPNGSSAFAYDAPNRILTERMNIHDTMYIKEYMYDEHGKPNEIIMKDVATGRLVHHSRWTYYKTSDMVYMLASMNYEEGGSYDSTLTFYEYTAHNKLSKKNEFYFYRRYVPASAKKSASMGEHFDNGIFEYTYDSQDRLMSEQYTNKQQRLLNYYRTFGYNDQGLMTKYTHRIARTEPYIAECQYYFFNE